MLEQVVRLFEKNNIQYCLYGGNLLGYARHNKSYIPWDDDIDLAVFQDDNFQDKFSKLKQDLLTLDMKINNKPFGYNITQNGNKAYIDLFIFNYDKNKRKHLPNKWSLEKFPNEYFNNNEVYPFIVDNFDKVTINIPSKYKRFLHRAYGKDCLVNFKLNKIHLVGLLDKIIISITGKTSVPA